MSWCECEAMSKYCSTLLINALSCCIFVEIKNATLSLSIPTILPIKKVHLVAGTGYRFVIIFISIKVTIFFVIAPHLISIAIIFVINLISMQTLAFSIVRWFPVSLDQYTVNDAWSGFWYHCHEYFPHTTYVCTICWTI